MLCWSIRRPHEQIYIQVDIRNLLNAQYHVIKIFQRGGVNANIYLLKY
jgi:hypothetical protein